MKCPKCGFENRPYSHCPKCEENIKNDILNKKPEASFEFVIENPDPELIKFIMGGIPSKKVDSTARYLRFTPEEYKQALLGMIDAGFTVEEAYNELKETYKF
ncbi:hypothetical protein [Elizabethkingia bruuniana]|uniref:hypothetical protein n=1 Tax=Elizabethkingia bruuniana TaxID=1756149 RepID=UPI00398C4DCD